MTYSITVSPAETTRPATLSVSGTGTKGARVIVDVDGSEVARFKIGGQGTFSGIGISVGPYSTIGVHTVRLRAAATGIVLAPAATFVVAAAAPAPDPVPTPDPVPVPPPSSVYPPDGTLKVLTIPPLLTIPPYRTPVPEVNGGYLIRASDVPGIRQAYARIPAWNFDASLAILGFDPSNCHLIDGKTFAFIRAFHIVDYAIWSNRERTIVYGAQGNDLVRQDVVTGTITVVKTFSGPVGIGKYEGAISDDDRVVALTVGQAVVVYDMAAGKVLGSRDLGAIDNCQVSRKGNWVVVVGGNTTVYPPDLSSGRELFRSANHGDNALNALGEEIFVSCNVGRMVPDVDGKLALTSTGVDSIRLSDGKITNVLPRPNAFEYGHTSGRNIKRPGWIYLSVYDSAVTAGRPGRDQVVAAKTDGSGTVEVFGFSHETRAQDNSLAAYMAQPHAVPSPDGSMVMLAIEIAGKVYAYVLRR